MRLTDLTISDYLDRLASAEPAPGGGAAAGVTGAQAAALLAMTGNLTRGRKYAAVAEQIEEIVHFCDECRMRLLALTGEDAAAFEDLMEALRAPHTTDAERRARATLVDERLRRAAEVPLDIMRQTLRLATPASILAQIGNPQLLSDVGVALVLIEATLFAARLNVLVNVKEIDDPGYATRIHADLAALLEEFREQKRVCSLAIDAGLPGAKVD